jgi:DnaB-like helicase C terminal domain/Toprim domain
MQLVISQGWNWSGTVNGGQIQVEKCPFCENKDSKFYMAVSSDPETDKRDGLYFCHKGSCNATGNLRTLQEHLGLRVKGVDSRREWSGKGKDDVDELPNPDVCHATLLGDADALDYLTNVRGFSIEVIERQKVGLKEKQFFRECGEVKALVFPYLVNGNCVFAKYRTLPPSPKAFASPTGWDAPLYNGEILTEELREVVLVEGEANTLFLLSQGVFGVVGVPGANVKKAVWIELLDKLIEGGLKVYVLYDNDKAGKKSAQSIASRIGYDKCLKMVLPYFEIEVPLDECKSCDAEGNLISAGTDKHVACIHRRPGKDVNEWFTKGGGTVELFDRLKENAMLFDVTGVMSSGDVLTEMEDELNGKTELAPTYTFGWDNFDALIGMENGDIIDLVGPGKMGKTTVGLNMIDNVVERYGEDGLVVCLEMAQKRLAKKWVCKVTGFVDDIVKPGTPEAVKKLEDYKAAIQQARQVQQMRKADIYFAYPQIVKEKEDVFKLIVDCIRRYGVKWIMFDNLQLLCDMTLKHQGHRTVQLSQISKGFAKIAKDYAEMGVKMIRIVQPKQIDKDAVITSRDVDGSSQIEKDCDAQILLWRKSLAVKKISAYDKEAETETEGESKIFDPKMKMTVALSRYSSGGYCWMKFDGAKSQVTPWVEPKPTAVQQNFNSLLPQEKPQMVTLPTENIPI